MRRYVPGGWLGVLFSAVPSLAQTPEVLTLPRALELAAQNTEPVAIAEAREKQAAHRTTVARATFFPTLSVQGSYQQQDPNGASARVNSVFGAPQYYGRFNLTQNVFAGMKDWFTLQSANLEASAAQDTRQSAEITLMRDTATLYYGVLAAERDLVHLGDVLKAGGERAQELKKRVALGRSRKADGLAALAQVSALEAEVKAAEQNLRTLRGQLAIRLRLVDTVRLQAPELDLPEIQPLEAYLSRVENRPDVLAQVKSLEMANSNVWVARAGHMPTLSASGNVYFVRGGSQAGNLWDVSALMEFPLFQGGAVAGALREATEKNKEAELALAQTRRLAREEILSAWEATSGARAQAVALDKAAHDTEASFVEQEKNYRFGQAQNLDVIQALNAWVAARRSHDRLRFQSWVAFTGLQAATALLGKGTP